MTTTSRSSKKKTLIAAAALLSIGLTGSIATGAYFTDQKIVTDNKLTAGTVVLGNIADDPTSTTPVVFTNVLPIDDSTAAKIADKAKTFNVNVRNNGTADIDWKATISLTSSAFAKQVLVSYSSDNGTTWSNPTLADNLNGVAINSSASLAANGTLPIKFRAWLPAATDNTAQGKTLTFTVKVDAIQAGAPWS
jgi:Neuraminidase (sialidase)